MAFVEIGTVGQGVRAPEGQRILRQTYEPATLPGGVVVVPQRVRADDAGGTFKEILRIDGGTVQAPALIERGISHRPAQLNVSVIASGTRRFWHVHPTQNELWTISYGQLNAGLVDCRETSPTYGLRTKVVMTCEVGLYIPAGVAHGYANESGALVVLHYVPDQQWSAGEATEEWRIHPDDLPFDFVLAETL
jgi:dTDP-4-dehydrorhamnose 3,5-epimerase-like enzyme